MGSLATRCVSVWYTALKLGRVSNLPTVWSNVMAAAALSGGAALPVVVAIAVAVSLLYVGGMFLNDAFDRDIDARERPERPIPAGEVSGETVLVVGISLLVIGSVTLAALEQEAGAGAVLLSAAILLYNWDHKGNPIAPFIMGACRALVYIVTAAAVAASIPPGVVIPAFATLAYVAGLTYAARMESVDRIGSLWPLAMLAAPLGVAVPQLELSATTVLALPGLTACAWYVGRLLRRRADGDIARAVAVMIAAISLNDALFASTNGVSHAALACIACFVLTLILQRYVSAS